jgi:hypothetical protein
MKITCNVSNIGNDDYDNDDNDDIDDDDDDVNNDVNGNDVAWTGPVAGDEVLMMFHSAGADIRKVGP